MSIDVRHVEELNQKVQKLNLDRQKQLGAVEQSKKQYEDGVKAYFEKYGVQLTPENLNDEYEKAVKEVTEKAAALEKQIAYIESGEYKKKIEEEKAKASISVTGTDGNTIDTPAAVNAPMGAAFADANAKVLKGDEVNAGQVVQQSVTPNNNEVNVGQQSTAPSFNLFGSNPVVDNTLISQVVPTVNNTSAMTAFGVTQTNTNTVEKDNKVTASVFNGFGTQAQNTMPAFGSGTIPNFGVNTAPTASLFGSAQSQVQPQVQPQTQSQVQPQVQPAFGSNVQAPAFGSSPVQQNQSQNAAVAPAFGRPVGFGVPANASDANAQMAAILNNKVNI